MDRCCVFEAREGKEGVHLEDHCKTNGLSESDVGPNDFRERADIPTLLLHHGSTPRDTDLGARCLSRHVEGRSAPLLSALSCQSGSISQLLPHPGSPPFRCHISALRARREAYEWSDCDSRDYMRTIALFHLIERRLPSMHVLTRVASASSHTTFVAV